MDAGLNAQTGIVGVLTAIVGGLFTWFAASRIKHQNRSDDRESRFESNMLHRLDAALAKIEALMQERDALKADLAEARARMTVAQLLADGDEATAAAFAKQSGFIDFERPLRPRPAPRPAPPPMDPFQAADPFAPKGTK